ncbi:MAG: DUF342 domain-containing protein [Selenomonadaceae bacterium]|nr:DUF342 domain-containing protein [Selenomonadaceae bacterium]
MADEKRYPTVGSPAEGYLFEFKGDGVFLTVYPAEDGETLADLSTIRKILHHYDVADYDIVLLSRVMREATGTPQKIAETFSEPETEFTGTGEAIDDDDDEEKSAAESAPKTGLETIPAQIVVDVSKDRMKVTIRYETKNGTKLPSTEDVLEALKEKNVSFGINLEAIKQGVQSLTPFVAAEGKQPIHGENAKIERYFDLSTKGKPVVNEYDRVDYKDMNLFVLAKKNDVLAVRIPQTRGKPGTNIYGDSVAARDGRPIPMPEGKNTKVINDNELIATINGQIVDTGRIISVDPRFEIKGDVGVGTGNIDFTGSVQIGGNVEQGFEVKASGDIEIKGGVNGGTVEGRNIFIGKGITGQNRGKVYAKEDVRCAFIESAEVVAGRDIYIHDVALHSNIRAGKKIIAEGKKGQIMGGVAAAGDEIRATTIGNPASIITKVAVGVNPNLLKKYKDMCRNLKANKERLKQITQTLNTLGKIDISKLPEARINQINALTRSQFPLAGQIRRDEKAVQEMEKELSEMKQGKIAVSDRIYPGTKAEVNSIVKNFQSESFRCTLTMKDDNVVIGPY